MASRAPHESQRRAESRGGLLLLAFEGDEILHAIHSHRGAVTLGAWNGPLGLEKLASDEQSAFVIAISHGALGNLLDRWGARIDPTASRAEAWLLLLEAIREDIEAKKLHVWPALLGESLPRPTEAVLSAVANLVLPRDRSAFVALTHPDGSLDTFAALVRSRDDSLQLLGPECLYSAIPGASLRGQLSASKIGSWLRQAHAPPHWGLMASYELVHGLLRAGEDGAWARSIAAGEVVVEPMPPFVRAAVGTSAVRGAFSTARVMTGGIFERFSPWIESAIQRAGALSTLESLLGFDPTAFIGTILRRSSDSPATDDLDD